MVGIVLVSHSRALAEAARQLVLAMTGNELPLAVAAGTGDNRDELGTDATEILAAIQTVETGDGALVLMDMGSAILSAETALDFLDEDQRQRIRLCSAPFIEGAVAAGVSAKLGNPLDDILREAMGALRQKQDHLHDTEPTAPASAPAPELQSDILTLRIALPNPLGLHARPAARLAQEAAAFKADIRLRNLTSGKGPISARSLTGLVTLEARNRHELEIAASGPEAQAALDRLKAFIDAGLGDPLDETVPTPVEKATGPARTIGISSGLAVGRLFFPGESAIEPPAHAIEDVKAEYKRLHDALTQTRTRMQQEMAALTRQLGKAKAEIFSAQMLVLDDPQLIEKAESRMACRKENAARAWWFAISEAVQSYLQLSDELLRQRAADLHDVGLAVLRSLGVATNEKIEIPEPGLIVVRDLTPGQVTQLDSEKIRGVICLEGGKTSHSAILLRSRGIPAIAQAGSLMPPLRPSATPMMAIINGASGEVQLDPNKATIEKIEAEQAAQRERAALEKKESAKPAITPDGRHIEVAANVGSLADAQAAYENGADGIGLLRTEFLFMDRDSAPSEDEQTESLRAIVEAMHGKPVVVRTLDAGGDKDLPYLNLPKEENPFLGVRAIRLCLRRRELFHTQLRAILRAATAGDLRIMFPMIATMGELQEAKAELAKAHESLLADKIDHPWPVPVGMMMEVPSAAMLAADFAPEVRFFSIGTNDLTQYTLAVDRGNTALQDLSDPMNPAVLSLIERIIQAAHAHQLPVAICGEAGSDPACAAKFLALGIDELSMNARAIPGMKHFIRQPA